MKSFVTLEQHQCAVCGVAFDTGAILLDKRLNDRFEHKTLTGVSLCPEHKKRYDEGYVALIEVDPEQSVADGSKMTPENAHRTGTIAHVKRDVYAKAFNIPVPDGPMAFCEPEVIKYLESLMPKE
jgi:hypothetical protein